MARRVFFSFHYQRDIFRVNVVRNSWLTHPDREDAGYFDASLWESAKKTGDLALKRLINGGLEGTSVTAVLIGAQTWQRPWVRYEILKSLQRGNGILGIQIHNIADARTKLPDAPGLNPLTHLSFEVDPFTGEVNLYELISDRWMPCKEVPSIAKSDWRYPFGGRVTGTLADIFRTYDWVLHDGHRILGHWVESAALQVGR